MQNYLLKSLFVFTIVFSVLPVTAQKADSSYTLFSDFTIIDGNGGLPMEHQDMLVKGDKIISVGGKIRQTNAVVIEGKGKTIMPALISDHVHIGTLKGTGNKPENYTRENIIRQLQRYSDFGVENILVMGTDRPVLFESLLRDSSQQGLIDGARIHSAGYGFGVPSGAPPLAMAMDLVYRPSYPALVPAEMDSLAKVKPAVVKLWVDDFNGKYKKMDTTMSAMIIQKAHEHGLRAAAHLYYLDDAKQLVKTGLNIIAHSIRDKEIDDELLAQMKTRGVAYIPTLSLDEYAYIYARKPDWINDPFFKASLESGAYEMISSQKYQDSLRNSPEYEKNIKAFKTALINLKKVYDAGILVALGTDSGATPVRAQGFSEHLEMELMVQAGLTPLQAITVSTKNAAILLKIDSSYGTLEKGKLADLIILGANPAREIKNTRKILNVYKSGRIVSAGPVDSRP